MVATRVGVKRQLRWACAEAWTPGIKAWNQRHQTFTIPINPWSQTKSIRSNNHI